MSKKYTLSEYGGAFTDMEALLDIYIFDTTENEWNTVLNYLYSSHKYTTTFFIDQQPAPVMMDVKNIFALTSDHGIRLHIDEEQLDRCHSECCVTGRLAKEGQKERYYRQRLSP